MKPAASPASAQKKERSPFQLGYRMPAEWEPHEATWLAWPHNEETWPGKGKQIEEVYLQMLEALLPGEKVHLLANDEKERDYIERRMRTRGASTKQLIYFLIPTIDAWVRDYGPNFICKNQGEGHRREVAWVKWKFNAWGEKYESLMADDGVGEKLANHLNMPLFRPPLVLEGGSIDTNGLGTVLTTEQCLLNPNRNRGLSRPEIEDALREFLGFTHFIWLADGIEGDDTDGHIDDIARFIDPTTVVAAAEESETDANSIPLKENLKRLKEARDQNGKPFYVVTLPMPDRVDASWGRLPASYLNFYIGNDAVLVPVFSSKKDRTVLEKLKELFPKRHVIGIRSEDLVLGMGAIHCVSHEQPKEIRP